MKKLHSCIAALFTIFTIVSCLQEERSPEEILVPSPAEVDCSEASLMLTSKVPSGSEKLVYECGFLVGPEKPLTDADRVKGTLSSNYFSASFPVREYGTTYYMCAYVTNGHGSEIRSDMRSYELMDLEDYVEFGSMNLLSYDMSSKQASVTIDADIWKGVNVTEVGVCYGMEPTDLSIEGECQKGTYDADEGVVSILLDGFLGATQYYLRPYLKDGDYLVYGEIVSLYIPSTAKVETLYAEDITSSGVTLVGEVTDECGSPVTERGFVWVEGDAVPTLESNRITSGSGIGVMTAEVEGLSQNKKYTFRAYAINASGTAYGDPKPFTTLVAIPLLGSSAVSNITSVSATFNGTLIDDGGESVSEVGFYYSTDKDVEPETSQKVAKEYSSYQKSAKEFNSKTLYSAMQSAQNASDQEGEPFMIDVFNLSVKTKYYVKSYATNSAGTAYGAVVSFETAGEVATIKTVGSSEVTTKSAVLTGNIISDNGEKIIERGFVWMEGAGTPAADSNKLKVEGETGEYTATLDGLDPNKKYSFRAYAINAEGTAYGEVMTFTTSVALPTLSAVVVSSISSTAATLSSTITYHGGETVTEVGFYYSTESEFDHDTALKVSSPYSADTFSIEVAELAINTQYYVKAYAINSAGIAYSEVNDFKTSSSSPSVKTLGASEVTPESAVLSGTVLSDNGSSVTERGIVWLQGYGTPTTDSYKVMASGTLGDFSVALSDLDPNKKYSFRAYAINAKGTAYGELMTFSTVAGLPVLSSVDVSAITSTSATFASTVTDHGGETVSEVGFYYSTEETVDPTTSIKVSQKYAKDSFTSQISDLAIFTKHFVKAYATNSAGTAYSDVVEFKTLASTPVVNTVGSSDITFNSATLLGSVLTDNGAAITERGFVWIKGEGTPTTSSDKVKVSGTTGDYTVSLSGLEPNVTYSYCAYAINELGTSYGAVMKFETVKGLPTLGPVYVSNVTSTGASFSGSLTGHGGETVSEIGFYYSTDAAVDPSSSVKVNLIYSNNSFSSSVSGLAVNTKYYVKSYAKNSVGIVYSGIVSFSTLADVPVVNTVGSSDITSNSAVLSGKVVTDNGAAITERGFVWVQGEGTPTASSLKLTATGTTGDFSATMKDLAPNQKYSFRAYAVNSVGTSYGETMSFTTSVTKASLNPVTFSSITSTSATLSSKVTSHGGATVTEVGFYYSTDSAVDLDKSLKVNRTYTSDSFSISLSELAINTKYYVKAYAVNSAGTVYSDVASFTTLASTPVVKIVGTSEVTSTSAVLSGTVVTDNGATITERGFVWIKGSDAPTTSSNKVKVEGTTGDFTATLSGLDPNQKYSFRVYAVNSVGTVYSDVASFTTLASTPVVKTVGSSEVSSTGAVLSGTVVTDNGAAITERGFVYMLGEGSPTTSSQKLTVSGTTGDFTASLKDLEPNKKYSFRAYAVNSVGTSYGGIMTFTTGISKASLSTTVISEITSTSAILSSKVTSHGGDTVSEVGFYYSTEETVDPDKSHKVNRTYTSDSFSISISELAVNTKYYVKAYATNSAGTVYSDIASFTTLASAPVVNTVGSSEISSTGAVLSGTVVTDNGAAITERGFVWLKGSDAPTTSSNKVKVEGATGDFTATLSDLDPNQKYSFRAYAVNSKGTSYGETSTFETEVALPSVEFTSCSDITSSSATVSGKVTYHGGETVSEVGFLYGTTSDLDPSIASKVKSTYNGDSFSFTLSGLTKAQDYYVQPFATNSAGTSYGESAKFTTLPDLPTVTTNDVTDITDNSAVSGGVIVDDGGGEILVKGLVWSNSKNPTIELLSKTEEGVGMESFTSSMTELLSGTTYYVRAYATNAAGTSYGEQKEFRTTGDHVEYFAASNCFIVSESGTYIFDTVKGNSSESVGSVASAEVLWETFGTDEEINIGNLVSGAKYENGQIYFRTADSYREGNAVIAAKDAAGTILWSWHIWLTDQPQEHVYNNNAGTMMDRNLGATSATPGDVGALGLLYQWGRKDPFLGSSSISGSKEAKSTITWPSCVSSDSSNGTIEYAISHPTTFIKDDDDWYYTGSSSTDDTRWQSDKTIYDPCPAGWRVPDGGSNGVWEVAGFSDTTYDDTNEGISFSISSPSTTWYPASGYRGIVSGAMWNVGNKGEYWSVTPRSIFAYELTFYNDGSVYPTNHGSTRAVGYPVRCLQEGTGGGTDGGTKYDNDFSTSGARNLSDEGTANSYIVSSAGTYSISPVKGNSSEPIGSIASAEVLWETFGTDENVIKGNLISGARYENGRIYFKTADTYREGNAVIAAKDVSGTILWSWHIWLTDQPQGQVYNNNAGTMMDRNLGATSTTPGDVGALGLLYQWGRKDPFLGSSSISGSTEAKSTITWPSRVSSDSSNGTIEYAISHPTTLIKYNSSNNDWYYTGSSSTDDTRWQSDKTIYDPCPAGWRVPDGGDEGVWSTATGSSSSYYRSYDSTNKGMNFSGDFGLASTIWYPVSGFRYYGSGALSSVGDYGYCWSVTPDSNYAYDLYFYNGGSVNPTGSSSRSTGFPVRCLQESE